MDRTIAVADCLTVMEKYTTEEITQIAYDYIKETLEQLGCSDDNIIRDVLEDDSIQADISFHVQKVIERGWNEGRIQARGCFMTTDWESQGQEEYLRAVGDALARREFVVSVENAKNFLEQIRCPGPLIVHDALRNCDDIMSPELCNELDMPESSTFADFVAH